MPRDLGRQFGPPSDRSDVGRQFSPTGRGDVGRQFTPSDRGDFARQLRGGGRDLGSQLSALSSAQAAEAISADSF
jgi:hypothetical protein